jgi:hypothetical protein
MIFKSLVDHNTEQPPTTGLFFVGFRAPIKGMIFKSLVSHQAELSIRFLLSYTACAGSTIREQKR